MNTIDNIGTLFIKELTDSHMFSTQDIKDLEGKISFFESQGPLSVNDFKKILGLSESIEKSFKLQIKDSELEDAFQQTVKHLSKNRKLSKPIENL